VILQKANWMSEIAGEICHLFRGDTYGSLLKSIRCFVQNNTQMIARKKKRLYIAFSHVILT